MISKKSPSEFAREIEELVLDSGTSYLDAITHYASTNSIEIEVVASLVKQNPTLRAKLRSECSDLNLIEKYDQVTSW